MRSVDAYLLDRAEAADRIAECIAGITLASFLDDRKTKAAVVREVEIIGEAARQIPESLRSAHTEVPWSELARLRNLYIHAYHGLDYSMVWRTATVTIPRAVRSVRAILLHEEADEGPRTGASPTSATDVSETPGA